MQHEKGVLAKPFVLQVASKLGAFCGHSASAEGPQKMQMARP